MFAGACREITGLSHGRITRPCGRSHGETVTLVPPCQNGVDDALATGAGRGFARFLQACSLHKHGTASTPIITIDLDLVSRFVREFHLGSGAALYSCGSPA